MRRDLHRPLEAPLWPNGISPAGFSQNRAREAHALLELAYAQGGGAVPTFEGWWLRLSRDDDYDPGLCFLAYDREGGLVGFAQCWKTPFVKDFAVHPGHRRRGIGRALLLHVFRAFHARGAGTVELKVQTDNPSALRFYENLGMVRA